MDTTNVEISVALQLWTVRDAYAADAAGTLGRIADLGYDGVELVDTLMSADPSGHVTRAMLDERGLAAVGLHAHLEALESDLDRLLAATRALGCRELVCAWVAAPRRRSRSTYEDVARSLGTIAAQCQREGVRLVYHHHDFEYSRFDGETALDMFCTRVPAELLTVELDTYWIMASGHDPATELERYGSRCSLLHLKDTMHPTEPALAPEAPGVAHRTTELGTGVLPLPDVLRAAAPTIRWYIVEQDLSRDDPLRSAEIGLQHLRRAVAELSAGQPDEHPPVGHR